MKWVAFLALVAGCGGARVKPSNPAAAELILTGGTVWTGDPEQPSATAVAIKDGRVLAVGSDAEVLALRGDRTQVIALRGELVTPGLVDGHAHLAGLGRSLEILNLRGATSEAAIAKLVGEAAAAGQRGWIQGRGWDQNLWSPAEFPTRASLDAAAPGVAVVLRRVDGHAAWLSSAALAKAGITKDSVDPAGGRIVRDAAGEPTGVLVDTAMDLAAAAIPEPDAATRERWITRGAAACLAEGLTGVHDMGIDEPTADSYRKLAREGRLPIRVYGFVEDEVTGPRAGSADRALARKPELAVGLRGRFTLRGIKLYADGALGSRGATLIEDYSDNPGNRGLEITKAERIETIARAALQNGWQIAVHAIGDRANRDVLSAYAHVIEPLPAARRLRFRIEHAQVIAPEDIPRFAALDVIAAVQPTHATCDMPWAEERLGPSRVKHAYAWRKLLDSGAHLVGGSDFPVEEPAVVAGLYAAVTRQDKDGQPEGGWLPEQRMTADEALAAFTTGPAYGAFEEDSRGMLRKGHAADVTVLASTASAAPMTAAWLRAARPALTIVDGEIAWRETPGK